MRLAPPAVRRAFLLLPEMDWRCRVGESAASFRVSLHIPEGSRTGEKEKMEGAAGEEGGEMADAPCVGVGASGGRGVGLWGGGWKRNIAIAGAAISSAPVVLPPLLILSAVGLAFSVPFGVFFAGYSCNNKIMRSLLPLPAARSPISPQPAQVAGDEAGEEFGRGEEDGEVWEKEEAGKGRTEMGMAEQEGELVGEPTEVEEEPVATSSGEEAGEEREEKRTPEGVRVPEWGEINGRQVFQKAERKEEEEELRGGVPSTKAEEISTAHAAPEKEEGWAQGSGYADEGRRAEEGEEERISASRKAEKNQAEEEKDLVKEGGVAAGVGADEGGNKGLGDAAHAEAARKENVQVEQEVAVAYETGTGKDFVPAPKPKKEGAEGGIRQAQVEEEMILFISAPPEVEREMPLQEGEGSIPVERVGREREGLAAAGPPAAVVVAVAALESEILIHEPSGSGPESITVVAERLADEPDDTEFCVASGDQLPELQQHGYDPDFDEVGTDYISPLI
ncbi:hypothetical protein Taro_025579 [Colocasia esculenta]|uniref:Uncharacterized protein n=1 Tax=Colocasia esculenta TaxID=4460 RepID=A0A843V3P9_COLES|nr:hypothetical protein [Colocasia esculenta]